MKLWICGTPNFWSTPSKEIQRHKAIRGLMGCSQVSNQDLAKVTAEHQYLGTGEDHSTGSYHRPVRPVAETSINNLCVAGFQW